MTNNELYEAITKVALTIEEEYRSVVRQAHDVIVRQTHDDMLFDWSFLFNGIVDLL